MESDSLAADKGKKLELTDEILAALPHRQEFFDSISYDISELKSFVNTTLHIIRSHPADTPHKLIGIKLIVQLAVLKVNVIKHDMEADKRAVKPQHVIATIYLTMIKVPDSRVKTEAIVGERKYFNFFRNWELFRL